MDQRSQEAIKKAASQARMLLQKSALRGNPEAMTAFIESSLSEFHNRELINWRRARSVIEHENALINHRITWLFASQALLLAAFGTIYIKVLEGRDPAPDFLHAVLCPVASTTEKPSVISGEIVLALLFLLGFFISFNIFVHLRNADTQLSRVTEWWYKSAFDELPKNFSRAKKLYDHLNKRNPKLHSWRKSEVFENENSKFKLAHSALFATGACQYIS